MALLNIPKKRKQGARLALVAACLAVVVVLLGAFTRLMDAGLGCPDWPGCYGQLLWPNEADEIRRAEALFPDAPVETDKTWPEMVHRYFAGMLGVLIAGLAFLGWKNSEDDDYPFRLPIFLLFIVVWQAMFGMWTVTLKLWPQVVTLHLLGGMLTLSLTWLLAWRLDNLQWKLTPSVWQRLKQFNPWLVAGIVIVMLQIMLGGWVSSNYAAFACPDLPTCHGKWLPAMDWREGFNVLQSIGPNYLGGLLENEARAAIHFAHRVGAVITILYLVGLCLALFTVPERRVRRAATIILAALLLQVVLGVSNVLLQIPLPVAVAHNGGGALLLLTLVFLGVRIWMSGIERNRVPSPQKNSSAGASR